MITVLRLILAYAVPTIIGYCLVITLERGKARLAAGERWALGFALGSGVLTFFMFYLGILGLPLTFWTSSAILWPCLILAGLTLRRRGRAGERLPRRRESTAVRSRSGSCLIALLSLLLAWKLVSISYTIATSPTYFDDSVSFWNLKAKVYHERGGIILDEDDSDFLGAKNPYYPNGIPLFKTWIALSLNRWSDRLVNTNTLFFCLCLGLVFYHSIRSFLPAAAAFPLTYALLSLPLLVFSAGFAYFDMALGFYLFAAMAYLYRWLRRNDPLLFFISAAMCAIGLAIKEEMVALSLAGIIPLLLFGQITQRYRAARIAGNTLAYLAIVLIPNLPWFWLKVSLNFQLGLPAENRVLELHPEVFRSLVYYLCEAGNFNIAGVIFLAVFLTGISLLRRKEFAILYLPILLTVAITAAPFVLTPFAQYVGNTASRAFLTGTPLIFFLSGVYLEQLLGRGAES